MMCIIFSCLFNHETVFLAAFMERFYRLGDLVFNYIFPIVKKKITLSMDPTFIRPTLK